MATSLPSCLTTFVTPSQSTALILYSEITLKVPLSVTMTISSATPPGPRFTTEISFTFEKAFIF